MENNNFEQLIAALPLSSAFTFGITEITNILAKEHFDPLASIKSLFILESWAWKLLSKDSGQWINQPDYITLFRILAKFNRKLIFNEENLDDQIKAELLIPETIDLIHGIFEQIDRTKDPNDPLIELVCLWLDNLSLFIHETPNFDTSPIIIHLNEYIARTYLMSEEYFFYTNQLSLPKLSPTIFTSKQLFLIKTCSFSLSSYLTVKPESFPFTAQEMMDHIGHHFVEILDVHSHNIDMWNEHLFSCLTHLIGFLSACCWWGGEMLNQIDQLFPSEQIIYCYINALVRIISYKPFYSHITAQWSNDETILMDFCLFSLKNLVQTPSLIWFFRSKISLPDTLLTIAELSIHDKICLRAYAIIGEILCHDRLKDLKITDNLCLFFYDMLEHAWQHSSKKYKQIPIFHLLRGEIQFDQ